ncbi:MYND-type domain-containing protein [Camponotus japonicus]
MMKCKERASRIYDNFELKWWLRRAGSKSRRCMLLTKLKNDLKKLSLSKRAVHLGLMQLARKPHVVLDRRLADCYRRKIELSPQDKVPLQLPQNSPQNFVLVQKERWQNDDEKKSRSEPRSLEYISQKTDEQIADDSVKLNASSSVTTASSEIRTDANKRYQIKIQERSLPGKKSSDNIVQNPVQEMEEKSSHVNGSTLTNDRNISAKTLITIKKLDSPVSKNKSPSKPQICEQKSENKNFHSKNETISAKNRSINKEHSSSENKLFKTNISIRLKKHYSISDIDVSKNDKILKKKRKRRKDKKKQKEETEVNQESSSPKINLLDSGIQERDHESESNDILCERNINVSDDTIISNVRTCLGTETNDITSENQDASISNTQTSRVDSELLSEQTHTSPTKIFVKPDIHRDENIRTKQMNSPPIEIDSKIAVKRKIYSESSDKSILMKKVQKKKEASSDSSLDENLSNLEIFDDKDFPEDKVIYNNESEEQMYWKITKYMKRKSKYSRKKTKLKKKRQNKIKRIRKKFRDWFGNCFSQSESNEELKIISECLERKKLQFVSDDSEMDNTFSDITTEEETEDTYEGDKISIHSCDTINNSQKDTESVISKSESINSSDSTVYIENDTLHDFTADEEINETTDSNSDKISIRKRDISVDIPQKNIENTIPAKIQRLEHSVSIADAETISKNDTKCSEDAVYMETEEINMQDVRENQENIENINFEDAEMKEVNMQDAQKIKNVENVDLAKEDMKISKDIESNLELSSMSTQKLISNIEDKNDCDVSQNIEDVLFKNNEDTSKNTITDHVSIMSSKSEEDSSDKKDVVNETFSAPIANVSVKKSDKNTSDHSSTDDDNISDIEVEIKIKPKSKSRVSRKFSLKAPLSAVNTCIKNLNTLKNNPDFLGELFQANFNTSSENSRHGNTTSEENEAKNTSKQSRDVNQSVTAQTASNTREIMYNSSHTTKDNANHCSKQQQERSSHDDTIFDRNKSATQHHQEGTNKQIQSEQKKTRVIGENGSESIKSACDASNLEKQLPTITLSDKGKTIDEQQQNSQDDITLKGKDATDQAEKNDCVQSVARKETRVAAENSVESAKPARDETRVAAENSVESAKPARDETRVAAENSVESAKPARDETRVAAENSVESAKPARDMPELIEQLPKTSSDASDVRRISGVRVRTNAELGSSWTTIPMNLSMNPDTPIAPNSTHSVFPVSSASRPPPSYNSSIKSMYHLPVANSLSVPTENVPPSFNYNVKLIQTAVRSICLNFMSCRNIIHEQIFNEKKICEMKINITRICQDIKTLKMLLRVTNEDYVINYINRQKLLIPPISAAELKQYTKLFEPVSKCNVPFCDMRCSNQMLQPSNISNSSVPSASMMNVHAQTPFLGNVPNVPLPGSIPRMQHVRAQSSTMPRPRSNINQSQSSRSTGNPLYSRQSLSNIRPKSLPVGVPVSNPVPNSIPNPTIKSQQPTGNASYVQSQYVPTNMVNINNQQFVVNLNNNPYISSSPVSTSNINVRVYPSANQGNTNISSTTGNMYSPIGTRITTTATINATAMSAINRQQQNQILYSQMPPYVISTPQLPLSMMNQNTNEMYQIIYNVAQPITYTNINVPSNSANVTGNITSVGFGDRFVNPQTQTTSVSAEKSIPSSKNVSNSFTSQSAHVQNISLNPNQQQQNVLHQGQSKNTSVILNLIDSLSNNVSQNVQPSVQNNRTKILKTQTIDPVPNKTPFTKPQQDVYQRIPPISQESRISSKIPMSQEPSILQNTMFNTASQKGQTILISPKTTSGPSSSNEIGRHCFDLSFLTELQKKTLLFYLQFYFERCSFPGQNSEEFQRERKMLVSLYKYLSHVTSYITKMEDKTSPMDIAQKLAMLRNFRLEIKLLHNETQCNKNNPIDKIQEKQSSEKNTDSNASINSKSTAAKNDLSVEVQNRELDPKSIPKFPVVKELLRKSPEIDLRKQNIDTQKMRFKRILSSAMRKESENITSLTRHSNIPEKNPIAETSRRISETEAQNDAKINKTVRSLTENSHDKHLSESCFSLAQDTPSPLRIALNDEIKGCAKITKDDAKKIDNIEIERISKISNVTLNNRGNDVILQSSFNSETQNNITDKEAVKSPAEHLHDKRSESCSSFAQSTLNLQYDETKNDNINVKGSENAEMANICKISNVAVLNNSEGNEKAASQIPCNIEARDKEPDHNEACNPNNKICGENSQNKLHDNVKENIEKSKSDFTEAQSDTSCISRTSTPVPNNTLELLLPMNKNESAKKSQGYTVCKKFTFETFSEFFSNAQEDPTNELINDSGKTYDESFESSGNLHIDENAEKSNSDSQEEQCDAVLSSEKNKLNTSQDLCFNETKGEPIGTSLSSFAKGFELKSLEKKETNVQELNEKLKQKELQTEGISSSKVLEDTSRASSTVQSIDIVKQFEDIRENQVQVDTHSGVKAINELLKHVSDKYYGKPRTSSCNPKSNVTNININETQKNVISNANVASPAKSESDDENSDIGLNILNITSIPSSLFEEMENSDALFQNSLALLNEVEEKELSYVNIRNHSEVANSVSSNEMKQEESSNVNENPEVPNSVSLNETKKEMSSDVNDNPEVSDSTLLNKIKIEESLDMNNTKVPNSAMSEMEEEMSLVVDENLEALCFASLNEIKIEELDIIDNPELPDSASLNKMKEEKSSVVNDNPEVSDSTLLNKIKIEESLDMNDTKVPNSTMNEMKEGMSLIVDENLEALCFASLNEIKIEELDIIDNSELPDSASLNEMKEEKSSVVNDNLEVHNFVWLPEIIEEKSLNVNDNPEVSNSTSLNEIEERKSLDVNNIPEVSNFTSLNEIEEGKSLDVNNIPEVSNCTSLNEVKEGKSLNIPEDRLDEMENRPCLRCKRKSTVYCQACLEAHYCSKRCSDLHWRAIHYKQCKNLYKSIICIDL